jgi:hypothetical protein
MATKPDSGLTEHTGVVKPGPEEAAGPDLGG